MVSWTTRQRLRNGSAVHMLERRTGKVPTDIWLWAAVGSVLGSVVLRLLGRSSDANFVGHWAPTFAVLALLSKLSKRD